MKIGAIAKQIGQWIGAGLWVLLSACQSGWPRIQAPQSPTKPHVQSGVTLFEKVSLSDRWIVSAYEARGLIENGAIVLDANGRTRHAASVTWQQFSQPKRPHRGQLLDDDAELTQQLQALGISEDQPVLVVGNPSKAWGEEGRIVWMLRSLGHRQAYVLDGGKDALPELPKKADAQGDFQVQRDRRWTLARDELRAQLESGQIQVIDSREAREYEGKTPYGESRGGHIPGAKHLYFKDLLTPNGTLLPHAGLIKTLEAAGITPSKPIVVYCTGGIRSGWLTTILVSLGYNAKNYPGSMWEWSAAPAHRYTLTKS